MSAFLRDAAVFASALSVVIAAWTAIGRKRPFKASYVADLPRLLRSRRLYVISEKNHALQASMRCPDGCGAVINLNLMPDDHPCWTLSVDDRLKPSLHPSVWRREDCGAHFFLRAGRIVWCE